MGDSLSCLFPDMIYVLSIVRVFCHLINLLALTLLFARKSNLVRNKDDNESIRSEGHLIVASWWHVILSVDGMLMPGDGESPRCPW